MTHKNDGTYTVHFNSAADVGSGVVTVSDLTLMGGDSGFIYSGVFREDGARIVGRLNVRQHTPGHRSIFGEVSTFDLELQGQFDGDVGAFQGRVVGQPKMEMQVKLKKVSQLAAE